jgi:hypothetical protein
MKKITKSVINLSEIPEELHKYTELKKYKLHSYAEFHIDNSEPDKLTDWLLNKYPTLNKKISFLIYIDVKNKEIDVPKGYYDQDSKDFEQASLDDFVSLDTVKHLEQQITELERYPDDMKLEEFEFKRQYVWDSDLQNLGLSNRAFGFGSEFGDTIYRLQKPGEKIRWCVFSVDRNYYISKEEINHNNEWCEVWTKQMDKDLEEAKKYCEDDAFKIFIGIEVNFCDNCKHRLDFKEAPCLVCESRSLNSI